ncbi:P-loop NTPase family protein [Zavarzinella formosa]|uniref:hypothetical protein n=1 Tax=Zavarzinella formosa TaxID=360055 RepID=UPI00138AD9CA|nr:hypothetical protein [Zavarzinella formosa]
MLDLANAHIRRESEAFNDPDVAALMLGFVDYARLPRILKRIDSGRVEWRFSSDTASVTRASVSKRLQTLPLIVIDDICEVSKTGRSFGEDHEAELKGILDSRGRRPLIATANLSPWSDGNGLPELSRVVDANSASDRVSDRLTCGVIVEMPGESRRRTR